MTEDEALNRFVSIVAKEFPTRGGGRVDLRDARSLALKDTPLHFADGVQVRPVVKMVIAAMVSSMQYAMPISTYEDGLFGSFWSFSEGDVPRLEHQGCEKASIPAAATHWLPFMIPKKPIETKQSLIIIPETSGKPN